MTAEIRRTWFVLALLVIYLIGNIVISAMAAGWKAVTALIAAELVACLAFAWRFRDRAMVRYVVFGTIAGFCELPSDAYLVRITNTLVYPQDEPMIWESPAYMPFAWAIVLLQICVLGDWVGRRIPLPVASVAVALISGCYIPIFEHLAKDAHLWYYRDTPMIYNAPYYVILAEFLLGLPLAWMGLHAERKDRWPVIIGLAALHGGPVILASAYVAFRMVG